MMGDHSQCICEIDTIEAHYEQVHHTMRKLTKLLECELSSCLSNRQVEYLDFYFRLRPEAFFVNDLPFICRLLELLPEKMYELDIFNEYYEKLLLLSGIPPLLMCSSELLSCGKHIEEFLSVLGGLLFYLRDENHIYIVLDSLTNLLSRAVEWPPRFVPLVKLQEAAANSRLPRIASRLLTFSEDRIYENLLKICTLIASYSKKACHVMVEEGAVESVLMHINPTTSPGLPRNPVEHDHHGLCHYEESTALIWILLSSLQELDEVELKKLPAPSRYCFWSLRYILKHFATKRRSQVDRNNMLCILLKILMVFPKTEFVQSGIAQDIVILNLIVETYVPNTEWSGIEIKPCMNDFIFVRTLLIFLPFFIRPEYYAGMQLLRSTNILGLKMRMLTKTQSVKWHQDHLDKLICVVVNVISQIAGDTIENFLAEKGFLKFMDLLLKCDHSIEVHLSMLISLIIMARMDKVKSGMVLNRLLDMKAHFTLIEFCESVLSKQILDFKYQEAVAYSYGILEFLYKRKLTLTNERLMEISLNLLRRIRKPAPNDYFILPKLPIMILSCLWSILLCDEQNLKHFIREEGVYIILDIAETSVWPVKIIALGLLSEIVEEALAIPFFVTWRGSKNQGILPFLLEVFREENRMLGVKHSADGMIQDAELPIMGTEQYKELTKSNNKLEDSPAISDMIGSCRPKLYAIIDMLTYTHQEEVNKANEIYKMWNHELKLRDKITLVVAENYFALKLGEVWEELQLHFERCGIRPLANDYELLSIVLTRAKKWGIYLLERQRDILRTYKENEEIKENMFYMELREARLGQALGACNELEYIARCTKELYRIRAKRRHNLHLMENPVENTDPNILYHTTFMYDIMVNPVFDQILHIANVKDSHTKPQISRWLRKAIEKKQIPRFDVLPPSVQDELLGPISAVKCLKK